MKEFNFWCKENTDHGECADKVCDYDNCNALQFLIAFIFLIQSAFLLGVFLLLDQTLKLSIVFVTNTMTCNMMFVIVLVTQLVKCIII